jgi:SAM-dependent methyltransferase
MTQGSENYVGHRILEAMHSAIRYSDTVFKNAWAAMPPHARRTLDFGAGDGLFAGKFRDRGVVVDCVEPDVDLQASLRRTGMVVFSKIEEIPNAQYDFVYTINVLEHVAGLEEACNELFRTIKPGGKLFVFVPAFEALWTSLDDEVGHVRRFTRSSLSTVLKKSGFKIERIVYFDTLGFPAAIAVRLLEKLHLIRYDAAAVGIYDRYVFPISRQLDTVVNRLFGKNLIAVSRKES